ncbi:MAG TPA: TetR/AcrR family transcriptional regulator [Myxococcota bacterium]|nr:TetR/AcrR family transcriptional regulator [Myxococcota bacterium]
MSERKRPREVAKEETREALLRAGLAEFSERGLDAPSLDSICARAGYTRGAFYVHFRDREEFVVAAMERVLGPFLDAVVARGEQAHDLARTIERFVAALAAMAQLVRTPDPGLPPKILPLHRLLDACERSPRLAERFTGIVREAIARVEKSTRRGQGEREVRGDVDAGQLGSVLVSLALGAIVAMELGIALDLQAAGKTVLALVAEPASV